MIKFKINGSSIDFPTTWEDLSFNQYLQILHLKGDTIQMVSILSGMDYEFLKTSIIVGLESMLDASKFMLKRPTFETYYPTIGPYTLPANRKGQFDVRFESLGQFEDMRSAMQKLDGDLIKHTEVYAKYVAIYLQKIRDGVYDPSKVNDLEEEVKTYKACEVLAAGHFFFLKLCLLSSGTTRTSQSTPPKQKKLKQVLMNSKRNSGHTQPSTRYHGK